MILELQNFVYSLVPNRGYDIQAWSPGINLREWRSFCEPPPVQNESLVKLNTVWAMQKSASQLLFSRFTLEGKDEAFPIPRKGQFNHHIIISSQDYIRNHLFPLSFYKYFITDPETIDAIPTVTFDTDIVSEPEYDKIRNISPNTFLQIIYSLLKQESIILVCGNKNTEEQLRLISAFLALLPPGSSVPSFITSPVSPYFRRTFGENRILIKTVQERPAFAENQEIVIDIDQDLVPELTHSSELVLAQDIVSQFLKLSE
jgi:hypothetical protein